MLPIVKPVPTRRRSLLTIDDVADIMAVKPKTVRAWIGRRELPFVRIGHNVRFREEVIDELIAKGEVPSLRRRRSRANTRAMSAAD